MFFRQLSLVVSFSRLVIAAWVSKHVTGSVFLSALHLCFSAGPYYFLLFFFAAFNGLISMFTRAYYLADTWNWSNILIERFTRVPNFGVAKMGRNEVKIFISFRSLHIHPFVETASLCEKGKYWFVFDLPRSSFQCFISWRTFKVYLQFKKRNIVKDRLSTDKQLRTTTITTKNPGIFQA